MVDCKLLIKNGLILRYIITIITYYLLYINISIIIKYLYLILPICVYISIDVNILCKMCFC